MTNRWPDIQSNHARVVHKYARKLKGGKLLRCDRADKVIHETLEQATACEMALEDIGAQVQYAYQCAFCLSYHLTRQRQQ